MCLPRLARCVLCLGVAWAVVGLAAPSVRAEDAPKKEGAEKPEKSAKSEGTKSKSSKGKKDDGHLEIEVTFDGKTETFETPVKANGVMNKALAKAKRAKEKDTVEFEATITVEKNKRKFKDPASADAALDAITEAMKDLKRVNATLADLGDIADAPVQIGEPIKWDAKKIAEGQAEVRKRIMAAVNQAKQQGNFAAVPGIERQEIEKAKKEGLIPDDTEGQKPPKPTLTGTPDERKAKMVEYVKERLQATYGKGEKAEEAPAAEKTATEKTATEKTAN